tara:strand:+ start:3749 stop:3883 length:135 start_codon:yes stop_codon:yes gene_type:complete
MVQHHKYSLTELEGLFPFELELYVEMLVAHMKQQAEEARLARNE